MPGSPEVLPNGRVNGGAPGELQQFIPLDEYQRLIAAITTGPTFKPYEDRQFNPDIRQFVPIIREPLYGDEQKQALDIFVGEHAFFLLTSHNHEDGSLERDYTLLMRGENEKGHEFVQRLVEFSSFYPDEICTAPLSLLKQTGYEIVYCNDYHPETMRFARLTYAMDGEGNRATVMQVPRDLLTGTATAVKPGTYVFDIIMSKHPLSGEEYKTPFPDDEAWFYIARERRTNYRVAKLVEAAMAFVASTERGRTESALQAA